MCVVLTILNHNNKWSFSVVRDSLTVSARGVRIVLEGSIFRFRTTALMQIIC